MGAVPGAREELDRLGRALRRQLVDLVDDLAPDSDPSLPPLGEPETVHGHEPLRHRYSVDAFTGKRPAHVSAADTASRAADLLDAAGWEVTTSREDTDGTPHIVVTARHDGCGIEIRTTDHAPTIRFAGRTPAVALHEPQEFRRPRPVRTAETVTPGYVLCYECDGLGWCHGCEGRGRLPDPTRGRINCPACHRSRVCVICRGAAELAVSQLSPYQHGYYPESER
ncbi:hypothetical protein ACIQI7_12550 [Kitasatospora sp. NPDC092039]|uniref:hypothetical protein n=1 Tax=Kitasatospora sp. NPDC092039 TaxID=3364086 RepID=UPI00380CA04D